jgi:hypothetical protein
MARGATNAFLHVDAVVEEDEVGQIVDSKAFVVNQALANRRKHRGIASHSVIVLHAKCAWDYSPWQGISQRLLGKRRIFAQLSPKVWRHTRMKSSQEAPSNPFRSSTLNNSTPASLASFRKTPFPTRRTSEANFRSG